MASSNFASSSVKYTYPYPIEVNVRDFVPIICTMRNYRAWRSLMLRLIESRGLGGFIHGEVVVPPEKMKLPNDTDDASSSTNSAKEMENPDYKAWRRTDEMLQRWIIGTIDEDALMHVVELQTAKDMWTSIEKHFHFHLHPTKRDHPYPTEVNVKDFVPITLSRENYSLWKKLMLRLINAQGLADFINGKVKAPSKNDPDYKAWKKTDVLLQSWIIGTTDEDLLATSAGLLTANDIWERLENISVFNKPFDDPEIVERNKLKDHRLSDEDEDETLHDASSRHWALLDATRSGDWEKVKTYLKRKPEAVRAGITADKATVLMVAVSSSMLLVQRPEVNNRFVKNLMEQFMSAEDVAVTDVCGRTALHYAAADGNIHATKLLVEKNQNLTKVWDTANGYLPIEVAVQFDRGNVAAYLFDLSPERFRPQPESILLSLTLQGLYDVALRFFKGHRVLTVFQDTEPSVLQSIAMDRSAFPSGTKLNWCQSLIYFCVPMRLEDTTYCCSGRDIENAANCYSNICGTNTVMKKLYDVFWELYDVFWKAAEMLVPQMKKIRELKCKHHQAEALVDYICMELKKLGYRKALLTIIKKPLIAAASSGISEIVEKILTHFPEAIKLKNEEFQNIFHIAVLNRRPKVFKLIYSRFFEFSVREFLLARDSSDNTCLDMIACLKSTQQLRLKHDAAGAALQMQQELQWFKETENLTLHHKGKWEVGKKTPAMVFSETHKGLVKEGEKWMKGTANSCTIVAALIATVVFAAAITVPGGNNDKSGLPILSNEKAFYIFFISDALALFSSTSSVLIFLSILTSRYAESDFLHTLPKRLIGGLITLLISIIAMMIAFGATLYLFGQKKAWILIPVTAFSCVPVTLFAFSQFPLLFDMIYSTYGPGIFGNTSHKISYRMMKWEKNIV